MIILGDPVYDRGQGDDSAGTFLLENAKSMCAPNFSFSPSLPYWSFQTFLLNGRFEK